MIISVWRYSHFCLAVSSFAILTIAALTGILLAFEPIVKNTGGYKADHFDTITLAHAIPVLKEKISGIESLQVNDYQFVIAKYADKNGHDKMVYVHPANGTILGEFREQSSFFKWVTNLHRSLFLHETGRLIVGIAAFLLILIALSGIGLVVKRQNGFRRFFASTEKTGSVQYYHTVWGRLSLIFILAIAVTGTYMSLSRFVFKPEKVSVKVDDANMKEEPKTALEDFPIFRQIKLEDVKAVQFPFSDFPEDYYTLQLKDREVCVNQFTGEILAQQRYPETRIWADFSLRWHTGRANVAWAVILAITSGYILFFIYSGLWIAWKRIYSKTKNKFNPDDCTTIILVGSENGSTYRFADSVFRQLLQQGEKAYLSDLDTYSCYPKAGHLIILASTYGEGEPPSNAKKFLTKLENITQPNEIRFSVVGFGSRNYRHFCGFAQDVDYALRQQAWAKPLTDIAMVNEKSPQDFNDWITVYSRAAGRQLTLFKELLSAPLKGLKSMTVTEKTEMDSERTFLLRMKSGQLKEISSGDILAIYPKNDHRKRLYSIGKVDDTILLSIKVHEQGLGSQYLYNLKIGETIKAQIVKNRHFHFPKQASQVVMISNGTGIAPFLGMISENKKKISCRLYCGFRTNESFRFYKLILEEYLVDKRLGQLNLALSQEGRQLYVSHLIQEDSDYIAGVLRDNGVIMICGSLSMQKGVIAVLEKICEEHGLPNIEKYIDNSQIVTDCY